MKLGKLIVGLGIGTVIGMLIAPKKGSELVDDINVKVKEAKDFAKDLKKEDVVAKFNETVSNVSKAVEEFDADKYKETTKAKLENLGKEVEKLKNKVVESEQFNSLVGTFNHIANTVNDKVDDILDELTDELAEAEMAEDNEEINIEEEIDDTAKEIEELIQEMNADSENKRLMEDSVVKKVTIYDVSREAGVSLATVSRVINGSNVVKESTRQRVMEVIERLDFKPNEVARGLAKSKTTMIAVVFPQSLFAHVKDMIGGIGDTSRTLKYNITIHTTDDIGEDNMIEDLVEKLIKSRVDGVILFNNELLEQEIERISAYDIPIVVIGDRWSGDNMGSVFADAKQITYQLVSDYLDKGVKDIAFFTAVQNLLKKEDLIEGIKQAYTEHGMEFDDVHNVSTRYEESYPYFLDYFKTHRPQVVITGYDKEGVAVINAARANGISIPNELEVIGMMNTSYGEMCNPSLTSVNIPVYNMGALALRLLTKILNNEEIETKEVVVRDLMIKRDSTK